MASEGINLHYQCHRLIHFDIPWSLMVFQQRNGRIDRYGQEREPRIDYLITESANPTIRGDTRILEVLEAKDEQAYHDIGDPSVFMGVFDSEEETRLTEQAMASGEDAADFDARYQPEQNPGDDLLALFLGTPQTENKTVSTELPIDPPLSLFPNHYTWARRALQQLQNRGEPLQWQPDDAVRHITLTVTEELRHRFKFLPREVYPEQDQFVLTDDIEVIKREIARSREDENAWPKIHYLWPHHPVAEWLGDRMLAAFGRHTAPVIGLPAGLESGEAVFLISGMVPNRKSHPLVSEWLGVCFQGEAFERIEAFDTLLERTGLGVRPIPNRAAPLPLERLQRLLPQAVEQAHARLVERRDAFEQSINRKLDEQLRELERLRARQMQQLQLSLERSQQMEGRKAYLKTQREQDINALFDRYIHWVEETMTTERQPWLQIIAVLVSAQEGS